MFLNFEKQLNRIISFFKNNRNKLVGSIFRETGVRLYVYEPLRKMTHFWFPVRYPEKWVFIIGCYNSGTTILREILGAHADISILPREGVRFTSVLPRPEDLGWTRMWIECPEHMSMPKDEQPQLAQRIIKDWSPWWGSRARIFLEKSITNVTRMRWLDENFDNAYFIGIVRNGYCAAEGIRRRAAPKGKAAEKIGKKYPISMAGRQWVEANEEMLRESKRVRRYILIRYEELVENPVVCLDRLWTFLGTEVPDIEFFEKTLKINGKKFEIENRNAASIKNLSSEDIRCLNAVIGEMQKSFDYEVLENAG